MDDYDADAYHDADDGTDYVDADDGVYNNDDYNDGDAKTKKKMTQKCLNLSHKLFMIFWILQIIEYCY